MSLGGKQKVGQKQRQGVSGNVRRVNNLAICVIATRAGGFVPREKHSQFTYVPEVAADSRAIANRAAVRHILTIAVTCFPLSLTTAHTTNVNLGWGRGALFVTADGSVAVRDTVAIALDAPIARVGSARTSTYPTLVQDERSCAAFSIASDHCVADVIAAYLVCRAANAQE